MSGHSFKATPLSHGSHAGPAPDTSNVLWKANVTGVQSYLSAFDGYIYVCTNTSVVALDQNGQIAWQTVIPMPTELANSLQN